MSRTLFRLTIWPGFTAQLFGLVVLPLAFLAIIIAFGGLSLHRQAMRTMVGERDERAVRAAASAIFEQINHREKAVRSLVLLATMRSEDVTLGQLLEHSDFLRTDFDYGLAFYDRSGRLLAADSAPEFWEKLASSESRFREAVMRDAPPSLQVMQHPESADVIVVSFAVETKGGIVAIGAFDPGVLARRSLTNLFVVEPNSAVYLVDEESNVLFKTGDFAAREDPENHPGVREAQEGNSGTAYVPVNGGEHVVSYSPVSTTGWALVIEEPWEEVTPPLLRTTEYAPFVLIPAFLLALLALWFGLRQIVLPLQMLETQAAALGWGDYEAIEEQVGGIAEIRHLQNELIHLAHKVRSAQAGLRGYIGAITTGQEEERRRLARELHDDTLQALIALNQRIHLARLEAEGEGESDTLSEIQGLTTATIENLRRLTRALRPIYLEDLGLVAALEVLARETTGSGGPPCTFKVSGEPRRHLPQTELALFRMTQEALNNVVRHAQASSCQLEIDFTDSQVRLTVRDDGQGFAVPDSPAEFAPQGHFGLLGLHERAELIGADLTIRSEPGFGTTIEIALQKE